MLVLGMGAGAPLAQDAAYRLLTLGVVADAPAHAHAQHVHARLLEAGDVALVAGGRGADRRLQAIASRVAHLLVLDALFGCLALADPARAGAAESAAAAVVAEHR